MPTESSQPTRLPVARPAPALLLATLVLCACGSTPTSQGPDAQDSQSTIAPHHPQAERRLALERIWLQSWFKGTPVVIDQRGDGPLSIDVPREFCFEPGRSSVKPALAAVLDKVAESLRRTPTARLHLLAAPGDGAAAPAQSLPRAKQLRSHLLSRGVRAAQLGEPSSTQAAAVQLRMVLMPQP